MTIWVLAIALAHAGSVRALVEVSDDGPELIDAWHSGSRISIRPGRLEVLDTADTVLATAELPDPRRRSIIGPQGGGEAAVLTRAHAFIDLPWPKGATTLRLGDQRLVPRPTPPSWRAALSAEAVPLQQTGPSDGRLDLVFLGDGYTTDEAATYRADVDRVVAHFLTLDPWSEYAGLLNIWRIDLASADSGVSHLEGRGITRDTALGCFYGCLDIPRLVCCDDTRVLDTTATAVPGADGIVVMVNDPAYGGSGGFNYAVSYNGQFDGHEVATHELGHSLVGLWDEYGYGYDDEGEGPNCSLSEDGSWPEWMGSQYVAAWQECSYSSLYRPTEHHCLMRTLTDELCPVCRQESIYAIYASLDGLVTDVSPPPGTELDARAEPVAWEISTNGPASGLKLEWLVDGEVVSTDPGFGVCGSGIDGQLYLRVVDDTPWVRTDPYGLTMEYVGPWKVRSADRCPARTIGCGCTQLTPLPRSGTIALALISIVFGRRRRRRAELL